MFLVYISEKWAAGAIIEMLENKKFEDDPYLCIKVNVNSYHKTFFYFKI